MGFHSHELGGYLRDDLSFPSDFALYFSVACVFLISLALFCSSFSERRSH